VAWGVLCRAWLPSPFFSVMAGCMRWYDLSMFGQVDGKERERERERAWKKSKFKNLLLPLLHVQGRRRRMSFKTSLFRASSSFFGIFSYFVREPKNG